MSNARNILVAANSQIDFNFLKAAFVGAGLPHHLHNVSNGFGMVAYLKRQPPFADPVIYPSPDLLILDVDMARADAFDVLGFLRDRPELKLPVILLSGRISRAEVEEALRLGVAECFSNPYELRHLIILVQKINLRLLGGCG